MKKDVETPFFRFTFANHAVNDVALNNTLLGHYQFLLPLDDT